MRKAEFFCLILGHARHGKDHTAEELSRALAESYGVCAPFTSSSLFAAERVVLPVLGPRYGYKTAQEAYDDRMGHRDEWFDLIAGYCARDGSRLAREMKETGCAFYVGMRNPRELRACFDAGLFSHVVWVHQPGAPLEGPGSMGISYTSDVDPGGIWVNRYAEPQRWVLTNPGPQGSRADQTTYRIRLDRIAQELAGYEG